MSFQAWIDVWGGSFRVKRDGFDASKLHCAVAERVHEFQGSHRRFMQLDALTRLHDLDRFGGIDIARIGHRFLHWHIGGVLAYSRASVR